MFQSSGGPAETSEGWAKVKSAEMLVAGYVWSGRGRQQRRARRARVGEVVCGSCLWVFSGECFELEQSVGRSVSRSVWPVGNPGRLTMEVPTSSGAVCWLHRMIGGFWLTGVGV